MANAWALYHLTLVDEHGAVVVDRVVLARRTPTGSLEVQEDLFDELPSFPPLTAHWERVPE